MSIKTKGRYRIVSPTHGTMTFDHIDHGGGKVVNARISDGVASPSTASVTIVAVNAPENGSVLTLGDYDLIEGVHWEVGVDADTTASNLAESIDNLSSFSAEVNGAVANQVDITGPKGPQSVTFSQIDFTENMTLNPDTGVMSVGDPKVVGPDFE